MLCRTAALLLWALSLDARVTHIAVERRVPTPIKPGFETLSGHFYGELDPKDPHDSIINDIQLAPRNARGMVEYSATFALTKPADMSKASGVLYYLVPNRGNGATAAYDEGHVSVISGWQGDLLPRDNIQRLTVPIARNPDGSSIIGPVVERLIDIPAGSKTVDLRTTPYFGLTYQVPVSLDSAKSVLTRRASAAAAPVKVNAAYWAFADCSATPFPGTPDPGK